MEEKAKV